MLLACICAAAPAFGQTDSPALARSNTAFIAALAAAKKRAPSGFTVVALPPFVVVGDESPAMVQHYSARTVKWAVDMLKKDFFDKDPDEVITIWLFKDSRSYTTNAWLLFHDHPTTPFGYYSAEHNALIMNIGTGGGTLVHELVHPFMSANFPTCPAWFNEGFASLFEQSTEKDGHICGMTNWRLAGLQDDIRRGTVLSFKQLTATSSDEFYGGTNTVHYSDHYAQARYVCYYLQERGLLVRYYKAFAEDAAKDPTGYATLQRIVGEKDMDAFKKQWETFVLGLTFP